MIDCKYLAAEITPLGIPYLIKIPPYSTSISGLLIFHLEDSRISDMTRILTFLLSQMHVHARNHFVLIRFKCEELHVLFFHLVHVGETFC